IVRWRSLSPSTALLTCPTRSFASNCCSTERSPLGNHSLASSNATELFCVCLQNCIRRLRQWSFCRLMAMRISQVMAMDSPRKLDQFRCAFRKQSWVSVSARSTSRVDESRNRKICGRCLATTAENSSAALSSAMAMVIGSNVAQAAITLVDARTGCKFTASTAFLIYINSKRGGGRRPACYLLRRGLPERARSSSRRCLLGLRFGSHRHFLSMLWIVLVLDHPFLELRGRFLDQRAIFAPGKGHAILHLHLQSAGSGPGRQQHFQLRARLLPPCPEGLIPRRVHQPLSAFIPEVEAPRLAILKEICPTLP